MVNFIDVTEGFSTHPAYNWFDYKLADGQSGRIVYEFDQGAKILHRVPVDREFFLNSTGCVHDLETDTYYSLITVDFPDDNWEMEEAKEWLDQYGGAI